MIKNIKEIKQDTFIDGTENCLKLNLFLSYLIFSEEENSDPVFFGPRPIEIENYSDNVKHTHILINQAQSFPLGIGLPDKNLLWGKLVQPEPKVHQSLTFGFFST